VTLWACSRPAASQINFFTAVACTQAAIPPMREAGRVDRVHRQRRGPDAVGAASLRAVGQEEVFNPDQIEYLRKDIPLRRLTETADIAHSLTWIASERAGRQVTGQVISVSGGYTMP